MKVVRRRRLGIVVSGLVSIAAIAATVIVLSNGADSVAGTDTQSSAIEAKGTDADLSVTWVSPPTPTSSRYLAYEIRFSEPVRWISGANFDAGGSPCSFTVPAPSTEYSTKWSVMMRCSSAGVVVPSFIAPAVNTQSLGPVSVEGAVSADPVEIINGTVLTVTKSGTGAGQVTSNLSGINCGLLCTGVFAPKTRVTLTARADAGNVFTGWSGACSGTKPCTVTLSSSLTAVANFEATGTVIVAKTGSGSGTVSARSTSLNCGSSCRSVHRVGQSITITASAARNSRFVGWVGACAGTGSCVLPVNAPGDHFVYAVFELK